MVTDIESMELVHTRLSFVSKLFLKISISLKVRDVKHNILSPVSLPPYAEQLKSTLLFQKTNLYVMLDMTREQLSSGKV